MINFKTFFNKNTISEIKPAMQVKQQTRFEQILGFLPFNLGASKPSVSVLRLEGVIGSSSKLKQGLNIGSLNKLIEKAFEKEKLEAVCLIINSPGGSPAQSELISKRISDLAKKKNVKLYAFVEDVAASGGYWLACSADKIFATKNSIIGSIGVISAGFGFVEAIAKLGVERRVFTQGKNKSVMDPFSPIKDGDIELIKKIQKEIHSHFINYIKEQRGGRITQEDEIVFNGDFWTGQSALDFGLIDGLTDLYSFIDEEYGDNVQINHIEQKQSWVKKFTSASSFGGESFSIEKFSDNFANNMVEQIKNNALYDKFDLK